MPITKQELARNLIFWLLPWPLSRRLPKSLLIAYFGPSVPPLIPGQPPPWMPGYDPTNPWDPLYPNPPGPGSEGSNSGWYSYLSDAWWTPDDGIEWDDVNQWWNFLDDEGMLTVKGSWSANWRPEFLRITLNSTLDAEIWDTNNDDFDLLEDYESETIHTVAWSTYDLHAFFLEVSAPGKHITDIQFFGPPMPEPS